MGRERLDRYFLRGCYADTTVTANSGTGGSNFAVDDAGASGVYPYTKMAFGNSGTRTHVDNATPLPITGNIGTITAVTGTVTVTGTIATSGTTTVAAGGGSFAVTNAGTFAVQNNGSGKTLKTVSASLTADTDVIAAVSSKRLKVYALTCVNTGTNADLLLFKSNGTSGTELWRTLVQGASGAPMGYAQSVTPPGFLFATNAGEKLTMDVNQTDTIHYSIAYWDDDAT